MNIVTIAAASCANIQQVNPQPVWSEIRAERPDVLRLLGDNIYLDYDRHSSPDKLRREIQRLYAAQLAEPHWLALLADLQARSATLLATYDTRFYRRSAAESKHDREAILGAPQWSWLEQTLTTSVANFLVVRSSTTFHSFGDESWQQYPSAFEQMRGLLQQRRGAARQFQYWIASLRSQ